MAMSGIISTATSFRSEDTVMEDAPAPASRLLSIEIPLQFDFDFELDQLDFNSDTTTILASSPDDLELRSPRTPTYQGELSPNSEATSPFNADRFFDFPVLSAPEEISPLTLLSHSPAAKSHANLFHPQDIAKENHDPAILPPPKDPLLWIWTCHLCSSRYPLGATRRCLIDGHYYCSGDSGSPSLQRNVKKKKRGQACSSEFDYVGWQEWGIWKQRVTETQHQIPTDKRDCKTCEYPSQCRYERMNKVPDVVVQVTKKTKQSVVKEVKCGDNIDTAPPSTGTDNGVKNLKISTGKTAAKKLHLSKTEIIPGLSILEKMNSVETSDSTRPRIRTPEPKSQSTSPKSPDLVDFSAMMLDSEQFTTAVEEAMQDITSTLTVSNVESTSESKTATVKKARRGASGVDTPTPAGLSKLTRSRSTKKHQSKEESNVKQSRISDFFGITG